MLSSWTRWLIRFWEHSKISCYVCFWCVFVMVLSILDMIHDIFMIYLLGNSPLHETRLYIFTVHEKCNEENISMPYTVLYPPSRFISGCWVDWTICSAALSRTWNLATTSHRAFVRPDPSGDSHGVTSRTRMLRYSSASFSRWASWIYAGLFIKLVRQGSKYLIMESGFTGRAG